MPTVTGITRRTKLAYKTTPVLTSFPVRLGSKFCELGFFIVFPYKKIAKRAPKKPKHIIQKSASTSRRASTYTPAILNAQAMSPVSRPTIKIKKSNITVRPSDYTIIVLLL